LPRALAQVYYTQKPHNPEDVRHFVIEMLGSGLMHSSIVLLRFYGRWAYL